MPQFCQPLTGNTKGNSKLLAGCSCSNFQAGLLNRCGELAASRASPAVKNHSGHNPGEKLVCMAIP